MDLQDGYVPSPCMTVDEQLAAFYFRYVTLYNQGNMEQKLGFATFKFLLNFLIKFFGNKPLFLLLQIIQKMTKNIKNLKRYITPR